MSLIQEALKRQQEDDGQQGSPEPEIVTPPVATPSPGQEPSQSKPPTKIALQSPAPPPPPPEAAMEMSATDSSDSEPKQSSRTWLTLAAVITLVLLFLGGAIWMLTFVIQHLKSKQPQNEFVHQQIAESTIADTPAIAPDDAALPPARPEAPPQPVPGTDIAAVQAPANETTTNGPIPEAVPTSTIAPDVSVQQDVAKPAAKWPALVLNGMVGKGANGAAIINKKVVGVGESIEGVKLISVDRQGVHLEYSGEQRFMKVGSKLP